MKIRVLSVIILCFITLMSVIKAVNVVKENGSVDLRCRIVGTRLSGTTYSPYFYKWTEADNTFFLDPNDKPGRRVNGNVVTPAVFRTFYFISAFNYRTIKWIWMILQYVFFFGSLILLSQRNCSSGSYNWLPVVIVSLFYLNSNIWFYNIERGQLYTFYLFIFSLIYRLCNAEWRYAIFFSGFINVVSIFLRPLAAVFLFPGILKMDKKWIIGCVGGSIAGLLLFVLPVTTQWKDYFSAMQEYSRESNSKKLSFTDNRNIPSTIEGVTNLQKAKNFDCGGLSTVQYYLAAKGVHTSAMPLALVFCVIAGAGSFCYLKKKPWLLDKDNVFLFAFLLYVLAELFIIGYRGGYNQVQWIFGIFLICKSRPLPIFLVCGLLAAILLENLPLHFIRFQFEFAEIILILILLYRVFGKNRNKNVVVQ